MGCFSVLLIQQPGSGLHTIHKIWTRWKFGTTRICRYGRGWVHKILRKFQRCLWLIIAALPDKYLVSWPKGIWNYAVRLFRCPSGVTYICADLLQIVHNCTTDRFCCENKQDAVLIRIRRVLKLRNQLLKDVINYLKII